MGDHARWCVSEWHPTRDDCTCNQRLANLAACLREAAGLCLSYREGQRSVGQAMRGSWWEPGCKREAPGFEGK